MDVVIIGAGRMGAALARRSVALGHRTSVLCRSKQSASNRPLPSRARLQEIASTDVGAVDLVVIAAPAWADPSREAAIRDYIKRLDDKVPLCSVAAYTGAPHTVAGRSIVRIICSTAIEDPKERSIVIMQGGDRSTRSRVLAWFGRIDLYSASKSNFDRILSLFIATAIHCEVLRRVEETVNPKLTLRERKFLGATLHEAFSLLKVHDFDPQAAFESCLTPKGHTRDLVNSLLAQKAILQ